MKKVNLSEFWYLPFDQNLLKGGIHGEVLTSIGDLITSPRNFENTDIPKSTYAVHLLQVTELLEDWPEKQERKRIWLKRKDAQKATQWREEMEAAWPSVPSDDEIVNMLTGKRSSR